MFPPLMNEHMDPTYEVDPAKVDQLTDALVDTLFAVGVPAMMTYKDTLAAIRRLLMRHFLAQLSEPGLPLEVARTHVKAVCANIATLTIWRLEHPELPLHELDTLPEA